MRKIKKLLATSALAAGLASSAQALEYNQNITAIFGTGGNPDQGWTTFTQGNIQLGLRAKNRTDGTTPNNGAGTYSFATGTAPASTKALWNFEFSANVEYQGAPSSSRFSSLLPTNPTLAQYAFLLSVDLDPSLGTLYFNYNPLLVPNPFNDNSYGNSGTLNGQGVEVGIAGNLAYSIAQNSQNITFAPSGNPLINGTYDFKFGVYDTSGLIGETKMRVVVGSGGAKVPDAGSSVALLSLSLFGIGCAHRKLKKSV